MSGVEGMQPHNGESMTPTLQYSLATLTPSGSPQLELVASSSTLSVFLILHSYLVVNVCEKVHEQLTHTHRHTCPFVSTL
jgi:hypothetical protein